MQKCEVCGMELKDVKNPRHLSSKYHLDALENITSGVMEVIEGNDGGNGKAFEEAKFLETLPETIYPMVKPTYRDDSIQFTKHKYCYSCGRLVNKVDKRCIYCNVSLELREFIDYPQLKPNEVSKVRKNQVLGALTKKAHVFYFHSREVMHAHYFEHKTYDKSFMPKELTGFHYLRSPSFVLDDLPCFVCVNGQIVSLKFRFCKLNESMNEYLLEEIPEANPEVFKNIITGAALKHVAKNQLSKKEKFKDIIAWISITALFCSVIYIPIILLALSGG